MAPVPLPVKNAVQIDENIRAHGNGQDDQKQVHAKGRIHAISSGLLIKGSCQESDNKNGA